MTRGQYAGRVLYVGAIASTSNPMMARARSSVVVGASARSAMARPRRRMGTLWSSASTAAGISSSDSGKVTPKRRTASNMVLTASPSRPAI
jgi:hypothetical protein